MRSYFYAITAHFGTWFRPERARTDHWHVSDDLLYGQLVKRKRRYRMPLVSALPRAFPLSRVSNFGQFGSDLATSQALFTPLALPSAVMYILEDSDGRIPHRTMMQFWQKAQTAKSDEHLGLHLAEAAPIESLGVHAYAVLSSPTLREGYRRACRYQRLIHEVTDLIFDEDEEEGVLQHALPGGRPVPRQPAEFLVALWVRFGRLILGDEWSPRLVCFAHDAPLATSEHERLLRTPIRFLTGRTAIHIPNHFLDEPNRKADSGLIRVLDDYAGRLLEQMPSGATLSARVRTYLLNELQSGVPTAEKTARTMHMSVRTLNRNLQQEGTTFRELLTQLQQEKAATLLTNPQISISEVGYLLGFSELSSFYRAFRTWTGTTPAEYRAAALSASNSLLRPVWSKKSIYALCRGKASRLSLVE